MFLNLILQISGSKSSKTLKPSHQKPSDILKPYYFCPLILKH
jgi:hypothetical protein